MDIIFRLHWATRILAFFEFCKHKFGTIVWHKELSQVDPPCQYESIGSFVAIRADHQMAIQELGWIFLFEERKGPETITCVPAAQYVTSLGHLIVTSEPFVYTPPPTLVKRDAKITLGYTTVSNGTVTPFYSDPDNVPKKQTVEDSDDIASLIRNRVKSLEKYTEMLNKGRCVASKGHGRLNPLCGKLSQQIGEIDEKIEEFQHGGWRQSQTENPNLFKFKVLQTIQFLIREEQCDEGKVLVSFCNFIISLAGIYCKEEMNQYTTTTATTKQCGRRIKHY